MKALLILAPVILFGLVTFTFWIAVNFRQSSLITSIVMAVIGIWFLRVGYISVLGLRYINIKIRLHDWGLEVQGLSQPRSILWSEISRVNRDPKIQYLSVHDKSNHVVFLVDYWINGFARLDTALKEAGHP